MTVWLREHEPPHPHPGPSPVTYFAVNTAITKKAAYKHQHVVRKYLQQQTISDLAHMAEWNFTHAFHLRSYLSVMDTSSKNS